MRRDGSSPKGFRFSPTWTSAGSLERNGSEVERHITVKAKDGLHARPAAIFVKTASDLGAPVMIAIQGKTPVPANSILAVMGLGVRFGDTVTLSSDSEQALDALDVLLSGVEQ